MDWLQFFSSVLGIIVSWPVAAVLIVFVLRNPLSALLGRLLSAEGPGGIKATFSELLDAAGVEVPDDHAIDRDAHSPHRIDGSGAGSDAAAKQDPEAGAGRPDAATSPSVKALQAEQLRRADTARTNELRRLAQKSPEFAITMAWRFLFETMERAVNTLAGVHGTFTTNAMLAKLADLEILPVDRGDMVRRLVELRNVARHGSHSGVEIDAEGADEYVGIVADLVAEINGNLAYRLHHDHKTSDVDRPQ